MSLDERQNSEVMTEAVAPFIVDSEYANEEDAHKLCKQIIVAFGGSGYKSGKVLTDENDSTPELLTAPIKIKEVGSHLLEEKKTYGGVVFLDEGEGGSGPKHGHGGSNCNSDLHMTSMPTTGKDKEVKEVSFVTNGL